MENKEIWKDIEGFEGKYQISSMGRVKSLNFKLTGKEQIMSLKVNKYGYKQILLYKDKKYKTFLIHRLVAQAFIPNPENKPEIDHINTNKTDNRVENLRWATSKENKNNPITIEKYKNCSSIPVLQFTLDGELVRKWDSATQAERELGFIQSNISMCCSGKRKKTGNYKWHYHYKSIWLKNHIPLIKRKKVA